jgi:hypothetical protein
MRVLAETLGYTMWWGSPAGMFVWVMICWGALAALAPLTPLRVSRRGLALAASGAGVLAVGAAASAVASAQRADYHLPEYRPLDAIYAAIDRTIPKRRTVLLVGSLGARTFRFKMAARFALVRRGVHPVSPGTDVRLGSWYELDHRHYDCVVYVKDGRSSPARGARPLAQVSFDDGTGRYPVSVWSSSARCPRREQPAGHALSRLGARKPPQ